MSLSPRQLLEDALAGFGPPPATVGSALGPALRIRTLEAGEFFQRAGDHATEIAYVHSGLLRMFYDRPDGKEFNKSFLRPTSWVGALDSLVLEGPSRLYVQAMTPSRLLVLPYRTAAQLADRDLYWSKVIRTLLEGLCVRKMRREASFLLDSAEQRYEEFLIEFADVENEIPDYHIASFVGITPVALSRIRNRRRRRKEGATLPEAPCARGLR